VKSSSVGKTRPYANTRTFYTSKCYWYHVCNFNKA